MGHQIAPIRTVTKNYGIRTIGAGSGMDKSINSIQHFTATITGALLDELAKGGAYVANVTLPIGHVVKDAELVVHEAFALGGTTPAVVVGTGSNTITLSEVNLESVGYVADPAASGTLVNASYQTAGVELGIAFTGTSVTADSSVGDATLLITTVAV